MLPLLILLQPSVLGVALPRYNKYMRRQVRLQLSTSPPRLGCQHRADKMATQAPAT